MLVRPGFEPPAQQTGAYPIELTWRRLFRFLISEQDSAKEGINHDLLNTIFVELAMITRVDLLAGFSTRLSSTFHLLVSGLFSRVAAGWIRAKMTDNWKESSSLVWTQKKAIHHVSQTILRPAGAYNSLLFQFINWDYFLALFRFEMKTDKLKRKECESLR